MPSLAEYRILSAIHAGERSRVTRAVRSSDGLRVALKVPRNPFPPPGEIAALRNEWEILSALDIPSVVKALDLCDEGGALTLVLEDIDAPTLGVAMAQHVRDLPWVLEVGRRIALVLSEVHQAGIVHRDVTPDNVLVLSDGDIRLIDFGIALHLKGEERMGVRPDALEGTLRYIAPEQTGRLQGSLDHRSDIYSLGAVLYEMLVGEPPFEADDAAQLVHAHIARTPAAPRVRSAAIPEAVSRIVMRCLEKGPDERYRSAFGLAQDLGHCLRDLEAGGEVLDFTLGGSDVPQRFELPNRLYGRGTEVRELLDAFSRTARGGTELVLIGGSAGVGKTALVEEIRKPVVEAGGRFVAGKFDQYVRDVPYAAIINVFKEILRDVVAEPEANVAIWRDHLLADVGPNGRLLTDVVPEFSWLLGETPEPIELGPVENLNRFQGVLRSVLAVFATPEHPLVVFLDDLQWAEQATLNLIALTLRESAAQHLLIIGANRPAEIDGAHPFLLFLEEIRSYATITSLTLEPLGTDDIAQLIADTIACGDEIAVPLAERAMDKTGGNPFFLRTFLISLHREGLVHFDGGAHRWVCLLDEIDEAGITDNVADLMTRQIAALPEETRVLLTRAASIGNTFDLATLSIVEQASPEDTRMRLLPAIDLGLLLPVAAVAARPETTGGRAPGERPAAGRLRFLHDRVQQAAYALIGEEERVHLELCVGRILLASANDAERRERLFDILSHLNQAGPLLEDGDERRRVASLDLEAGRRAKSALAYDSATHYLEAGLSLLPPDRFTEDYELAMALSVEKLECLYLGHHLEEADGLFGELQQRTRTNVGKVQLMITKMMILHNAYRYEEELDLALQALGLLGFHLSRRPSKLRIGLELAATVALLRFRQPRKLGRLPRMTDSTTLLLNDLLVHTTNSSYFVNVEIGFVTTLKQIRLALRYGNAGATSFAYIAYGIMLSWIFGRHWDGRAFGELALEISERYRHPFKGRNYFTFAAALNHWTDPIQTSTDLYHRTVQDAMECGDIMYVAYGTGLIIESMWMAGADLADIAREYETRVPFLERTANDANAEVFPVYRQLLRALRGELADPLSFDGPDFDEREHVAGMLAETNRHLYSVAKLQVLYLFGDYEHAREVAKEAERLAWASLAQYRVPEQVYYHALTVAQLHARVPEAERPAILKQLRRNLRRLRRWAKDCPVNYQHKALTVQAECYRLRGKDLAARRVYEAAIEAARTNRHPHNLAIALELAGRHYAQVGLTTPARGYLQEAHYAYSRWGAFAKAAQLRATHGSLLDGAVEGEWQKSSVRGSQGTELARQVDVSAIVKASQAIAREIHLDALLERLLQVVLENAGADRAVVLMGGDDDWRAFAEARASGGSRLLEGTLLGEYPDLCESLVQYVAHTGETRVVADARSDAALAADPHVRRSGVRSLLAMPVLHQGKITALLYLENSLTTGAFPAARVELLRLLTSSIAISMENAKLYDDLERRVEHRTAELAAALDDLRKTQRQLIDSEKLVALGSLVAGVAHEVNTPVGIALTSASFLAEQSEALSAKVAAGTLRRSDLDGFLASAAEASRLTQSNLRRAGDLIRSFKQVAADQTSEEPRSFNLRDYLEDVVTSLGPEIKKTRITVRIDGPGDLVVETFPGHLSQIVTNLVLNTIHHAYSAGEPGEIDISLSSDAQDIVHIVYADHGKGMPPEIEGRAFDPFFTTRRGLGGTGLGMPIIHNLVTGPLGGSIRLQTAPGEGTAFYIDIPARRGGESYVQR